jgi:NADH dehydrogenase
VRDIVTGAWSYTGRFIALRLLAEGHEVVSLSRRSGQGLPVRFAQLQFDDAAALAESMRGAHTLYNTYWIRFPRGTTTFAHAVENTRVLFRAAAQAGVERIVHVSVTNPSLDSPYPYFRGKAQLEHDLAGLGIPYAVVRPTLVFGPEDILVNNIAWILRRLPLFLVPGRGDYRVQPVAVEDVAEIALAADGVVDAAGPDTFTFEQLVRMVGAAIGRRAPIVRAPAVLALGLTTIAGWFLRDVVLTRDELYGLMDSLLTSAEPPRGARRFGDWLHENGQTLGRTYVSELERNWR